MHIQKKFIDKCIQTFLNNMFIQRLQIPTVPKKELIIILPYLVNWELFSKLIIDLKTIFASKTLFLKHYGQT